MNRRIQSSKHAQRKKRIFKFRLILAAVFVVVLIAGLSFWSRHEAINIDDVQIVGSQYVEKSLIYSLVTEELVGNYLFLFPRTNFILIPKSNIKDSLYTEIRAIEKVKIDRDGRTLFVEVTEFEPVALWCNNTDPHPHKTESVTIDPDGVVEVSDEEGGSDSSQDSSIDSDDSIQTENLSLVEVSDEDVCYFVNQSGLIFIEEPKDHEYDLPKLHNIVSGNPIGQIYVSSDFFKIIQEFKNTLETNLDVHLAEVFTEDEITYKFLMKEGPYLLIDSTDDFVSVADNLATLIEQDAINRPQFSNIQYIDLRFGNRIFYKLK